MVGRVTVPLSSRLLKNVLCLAAFGLSATVAWGGQTCTVSSTADTNINGTLRYCLNNLGTGAAVDTNAITFSVTGKIALTGALPDIEDGVTITGPGATNLTIDGGGLYQAISIGAASGGPAVSISGLTFANGRASTNGGAIYLDTGSLTVSNSVFSGNSSAGYGGAIANVAGTLTVTGSTFTQNSATSGGAAIYSANALDATTLILTNDTFYGNTTTGNGGAIYSISIANVTNNTFVGNSASGAGGGAIYASGSGLTADNNLLVGNTNSTGAIANGGTGTLTASYNVYNGNGGSDCSNCTSSNAVDATSNPLALPLGYYGGTTETYLPQPGSAAICAGLASDFPVNTTTDQRGFALSSGSPCASSASVDAGAVQTNYVQVQNSGDTGGSCPGSSCRLRGAIASANTAGYGDIDFASGVTSITAGSTLQLSGTTGINIIGNGANTLTVNGGGSSSNFSVFTVNANVPAVLYGLTISNGGNSAGHGGGISNLGDLALLDSAVAGNSADVAGGIFDASGSTLLVMDSTISGNTSSAGAGGGINNAGKLEIIESTVSGNTSGSAAGALGGGIFNSGTLTIIDSSISANQVTSGGANDDGGGLYVNGGSATLQNTIVSGNISDGSDPDVFGYSDNGTSGNVIGGNISLSALGSYPSTAALQTQIPLPGGTTGNPAICAGKSANVPSTITTDERGGPISPNDCPSGSVDAGAVQTNFTSLSFTTSPSGTNTVNTALSPAPVVLLDESGQPFTPGGVTIPLTLSSGTLYGTTSVAVDSSGSATYSSLDATAGSSLTLSATLQLNSTLQLTAQSSSFGVNQAATTVATTASGSNPGSPAVGDSLGFVATLSPQNPAVPFDSTNGTVTFSDVTTSKALCFNVPITAPTGGVYSVNCNTTALDAEQHQISAVYNGDANYLPTASTAATKLSVTVGPAPTSVVVTAAAGNPITPTYGGSFTFDAAVTPLDSNVPFSSTGTVTFSDGGNPISCTSPAFTPSTGIATCTTTSLGVGSHNISAVYNGDSNYSATQNGAITQLTGFSIGKATPSASLGCTSTDSSSPACLTTIALNSTETFTATITGPSGATTPTGKITFQDNGNYIAGCGGASGSSLSSGSVTCSTKLASGSHSVVASYGGDGNYTTVQTTQSVSVGQTNSSTTLTSSTGGTSTVNQLVTFTVTVGPANANPALSGTVTVLDTSNNNAVLCAGTVDPTTQQYPCSTQALALGTHKIEATYTNDSSYAGSTSSLLTQQVNAGTATMPSFASSSNPSVVGNTVTFTATISVPSGPTSPAGNVSFAADGTTIAGCGSVALTLSSPHATSGTASCPTKLLAASTTPHTIVASYTGDSNFIFDGQNNSLSQTVSAAATTTTIIAAPSTTTVNQQVTYTVTVTAPSTTYPLIGLVKITDDGTLVCDGLALTQQTGSPEGTSQQCTESKLTAGVHTITAVYYKDSNNGSSSGSTTVPVQAAGSSVVVTSSLNPSLVQNPNNVNDTVSFTATVASTGTVSVPLSGVVIFTANGLTLPDCPATQVNSNGQARCTTTSLVAGTDTILAVYSNDPNYTGSSGYLSANGQIAPQLVQDFSLAVSSAPPVAVSQGSTTSNDLFSPQTITVVPLSTQGFATASGAPLTLGCTVSTVFSPASAPTTPLCTLASNNLAVNGTGPQAGVGLVVDASNASAGLFSVQVSGKDPTTGLAHVSVPVSVLVRAASTPLTLVSGATTGNSASPSFLLPGGVTLSNLACASVSGPNLTGSVSPATLGISCSFNPTSVTNTSSNTQSVQVMITVNTAGSSGTSAAAVAPHTNLWLAGLLGLPLFGLIGVLRGRKSPRSVFFRMMAILVICAAGFQAIGCGGSFVTQPSNASSGGKTPPGVYKVLVAGTGSDGQTYEAVLQLNVQL
jgi:hypothetical protein